MQTSFLKNHLLIALFTSLMAIGANIVIPFAIIPFTMQSFVLYLIGLTLNPKQSIISTTLYLFLGLIGLPIFSGFKFGIAIFLSPTAGFLLSFPIVAISIAYLKTKLHPLFAILTGYFILFSFGLLNLILLHQIDLKKALIVAVIPFIISEVLKMLMAFIVYKKIKKYIN